MTKYTFRNTRTIEEVIAALRVRHAVFAIERNWVDAHPNGIEYDCWDVLSTQFAAIDQDGKTVGTTRAIGDNPLGFPFEKIAPFPSTLDRATTYEVSRLSVLPDSRGDNSIILVGLCRALWKHESHIKGMENWIGVVDKPVVRLLRALGFAFLFEGEEVYHLGSMSVPIACSMEQSREILFSPKLNERLQAHIEEIYSSTLAAH